MGIIKAVAGAVSGMWEEQWKEIFSCDALPDEVLMRRATKWVSQRSTNTRTDDNVVTEGSLLIVADGQAVIVVSGGRVVDVCTEPGEHLFHDETRGRGLSGVFREIGNRVAFGGDIQPVTQRVYYVNTKEIMGRPFHSGGAIPYRTDDRNLGLSVDTSLTVSGIYSYRITDPAAFYKQAAGNVSGTFTRGQIAERMTREIQSGLQPAIAKLSGLGLRPSELPAHTEELADALRAVMAGGWCARCGLGVVSVGIAGMTIKDRSGVTELQMNATLRDEAMRQAYLAGTAGQAVRDAAGGRSAAGMAAVAAAADVGAGGMAYGARPKAQAPGRWTCACGTENTGAFCHECGRKRPAEWRCVCGTVNEGNFCRECGRKRQ